MNRRLLLIIALSSIGFAQTTTPSGSEKTQPKSGQTAPPTAPSTPTSGAQEKGQSPNTPGQSSTTPNPGQTATSHGLLRVMTSGMTALLAVVVCRANGVPKCSRLAKNRRLSDNHRRLARADAPVLSLKHPIVQQDSARDHCVADDQSQHHEKLGVVHHGLDRNSDSWRM